MLAPRSPHGRGARATSETLDPLYDTRPSTHLPTPRHDNQTVFATKSPRMTTPAPREFYDSQYHYEEDAARPDEKRIWHALKHLQPLIGTDFFDLGCGAGWATRLAKQTGA